MPANPYIPNKLKSWCHKCKAHTPSYDYARPADFGRANARCRQCDEGMDAYAWRRLGCGCLAGPGFVLLIVGLILFLTKAIGEDGAWAFLGGVVFFSVPFIWVGLWIGSKGRGFLAWEREQNSKSPAQLEEEFEQNPVELNFPAEGFETRVLYGDWRDYQDADSGIEKVIGDLGRELSGGYESQSDAPTAEAENLEGAELENEDFEDADLREANLKDANLQGADLRGADLRNANLTGANLAGANLQGADLNLADFSRANIEGADLRGVQGWRSFFSGARGTPAYLPGDPLDE